MELYVCTGSHPGNFFVTPGRAIEQDEHGTYEVDALCKCGSIAVRVQLDDTLLVLSQAELTAVVAIEKAGNTEPLLEVA